MKRSVVLFLIMSMGWGATVVGAKVPGVIITHSPASSKIYIGSPGIAVLPNWDYVAKCDEFGPGSTERTGAITRVCRSRDRGQSWEAPVRVKGMYWASIFVHRGDLYLMGTERNHGATVIRRSRDGGRTWSEAKDASTGRLLDDGKYHTAPVPVAIQGGRIWRAMEDAMGPGGWGSHFRAFMMSAPVGADLLKAENWTCSNRIGRDPAWLGGRFRGWLEGNAVVTPAGEVVNILRVDVKEKGGKAAVIRISGDGRRATFDPEKDFIDFPGGCKKFTIRYDEKTKRYWTLANAILPRHQKSGYPGSIRNAVALMSSRDLRAWTMRSIVLYHPDVKVHGFQYPDWLFEGDDFIGASGKAYVRGEDVPPKQHDANFLTFHRFGRFRDLTMADSAAGAKPGEAAWRP